MKKEFNITGKCIPANHYMADVSSKLTQTIDMVEKGNYFIINRPRQYGKTTALYSLAFALRATGEYIVFNISFEGVGDSMFNDEEVFSQGFTSQLATYAHYFAKDFEDWLQEVTPQTQSLKMLSQVITDLTNKTDKKIVILIDEVDKSSNNQLFVSFLAMLRNKYLTRDEVKTFHSVVLAGVHDVKSLKLKLRPDEEQKYNSPWNIATDFNVDMNLQPSEIKPMLEEYAHDKAIKIDSQVIAERLFYYTSGYPFLVSKLCKICDEQILPTKEVKELTEEDLFAATRILVKENNTNFESLIKNLENNPDLYSLVYKVAVDGESLPFNINNATINLGALYGIFVDRNGLAIHNRIYSEVMLDYMSVNMLFAQLEKGVDFGGGYKNRDNSLNMEAVLLGFQAFMKKEYSKKDRDFLERQGRLVFLAFIKPIINGSGYDFKETQISEERRLDVVITYLQHRYLAELKIWRGEAAHQQGLLQLSDYLNRLSLTEGYLLIFDNAKRKSWKKEWVEVEGKKVFVVWV